MKIRKIFLLALGWGFVILGIAGLFLPILQGLLFLIIGLILLSSEYVWAHQMLEALKKRFPSVANRSHETSRKVGEWFSGLTGSVGKYHASVPCKLAGATAAISAFHLAGPASANARTEANHSDLADRKQGAKYVDAPAHKSKIMIALRDPEHVDNLVKVACQLSNQVEADVLALSVSEIGPGLPLDLELPMLDESGKKVLSHAVEVASQHDKKISTHLVRAHHAGNAIVTQARNEWVNLLIMGYRAKRGLREIVFGSTLRYVIEHTPCQVIVEILPQEAVVPCGFP